MKKTFLLATLMAASAHAYEAKITKGQLTSSLDALLEKASSETGATFKKSDFLLIEERELATSKFTMYVQTNSMIPVAETAVRIWTDLNSNELILAELHLNEKAQEEKSLLQAKFAKAKFSAGAIKSKQLSQAISAMIAKEVAKHTTDAKVISMKSRDQWENGDLVRVVEVRARRGQHRITVSLLKNRVIRSDYTEFPQSETVSLQANVFPIYEEVEGTGQLLETEVKELRHIHSSISDAGENPLGALDAIKFREDRYSPLLAGTALGDMYDLWSEASIRKTVEGITAKLPVRSNSFEKGLLLQGKFATIQIHPAAKEAFKDINFDLKPTVNHMLGWNVVDGAYEAKPTPGFAGKPLTSAEEALARIPYRHPKNDPVTYINSGVDELQVYYAVTVLMESLADMGFSDKELSEKPFHAFLFDPDIGMQNNAYYTDNTINFTTYTPTNPNLARDNPTIWHELGHGVMDRLMGPLLTFGDTKAGYGGLSEGMADFVASIVVEDLTNGKTFPGKQDFRIVNNTGFYLTNEFHDEGEAYGGVLNDMLHTVIKNDGREGLVAFTDLTLEAMRLTRNHPALTAALWFEHMVYADSLGSAVRAPNRFTQLMNEALSKRNFAFDPSFKPAQMKLSFKDTVLTSTSPASREKALKHCVTTGAAYDLKLAMTAGDSDFIKFPATVKVEYQKGALQGAIKWAGEESNPQVYTVADASELLTIPVQALGCDSINQPDGSCKDYAYVQIYNQGEAKPIAKKRFYLNLSEAACETAAE